MTNFEKVKAYLQELDYEVVEEVKEEELVVVEKESVGIKNLILDCEGSVLVIELLLFERAADSLSMCQDFLKMNRTIIHGAVALDESGVKFLFRDTLQLDSLDLEELQATLHALELFLSEQAAKLLTYAS